MKWAKWLENWDMTGLRINVWFLDMDWEPNDADKDAAWDMYIELLTRITTQPLPAEHGDEKTALDSVYHLFPLTREIIRKHGRDCIEFTKIAIVVLNQRVRPFTAEWHKKSLAGAFDDPSQCREFRRELAELQETLKTYTKMLADMAGVEDLTALEEA
ncbi:hypothetical protein GF339_01000 [candidate division KSB3 bacterium]|uniref:Uncharacterized protein n=1 Tax=candidate division KSB3 bacterium TaxID=2044937 RepID=A0A9D5Q4F2_9BACT|nr:hypothetical protein [candidate division KSB3 bacterium]MBD3323127.1 hypothetical protein [candidate division KSB3 bacterium]